MLKFTRIGTRIAAVIEVIAALILFLVSVQLYYGSDTVIAVAVALSVHAVISLVVPSQMNLGTRTGTLWYIWLSGIAMLLSSTVVNAYISINRSEVNLIFVVGVIYIISGISGIFARMKESQDKQEAADVEQQAKAAHEAEQKAMVQTDSVPEPSAEVSVNRYKRNRPKFTPRSRRY